MHARSNALLKLLRALKLSPVYKAVGQRLAAALCTRPQVAVLKLLEHHGLPVRKPPRVDLNKPLYPQARKMEKLKKKGSTRAAKEKRDAVGMGGARGPLKTHVYIRSHSRVRVCVSLLAQHSGATSRSELAERDLNRS
jgi:hypothetical protein